MGKSRELLKHVSINRKIAQKRYILKIREIYAACSEKYCKESFQRFVRNDTALRSNKRIRADNGDVSLSQQSFREAKNRSLCV